MVFRPRFAGGRSVSRPLLALALMAAAVGVAWVLRRRGRTDAPTQVTWKVPVQIDRTDFAGADRPWLVALFSSATCDTCQSMAGKVQVLESTEVAIDNVEHGAQAALHKRYSIDAVPLTVVADHEGVVRASFVGPVSATDLWAAVAEVRNPGSSPEPHLGR
jgi:hypothetical protein